MIEKERQKGIPQGISNDSHTINTPEHLQASIISLIKSNPQITRNDMANILHFSPKTIARQLKLLEDKVRYVGSGYSGHWEIITD